MLIIKAILITIVDLTKVAYILLFLFLGISLSAQSFQDSVRQELSDIQVQLFTPAERTEYTIKPDRSVVFPTDFIIKHTDKVEVRVEFFSWEKDSIAISNPNIKNGIRLGQLVDNLGESKISLHRLGSEDLVLFGADWATQATFKPKPTFSDKKHCQLITLYKEETGLIFLYLLFDNMEKYKDEWRYLIGFADTVQDTIK